MLEQSQIDEYHKNGFLLVENVLTQPEIASLRQEITVLFEQGFKFPGDTSLKRGNLYGQSASLRTLFHHPLLVPVLKSLMGEDYFAAEETLAAHQAFYSKWHTDTDYYDMMGQTFHLEPDFLMLQVALYLQDNDPVYGGGLEVIPGSHRERLSSQNLKPQEIARRYAIPHKAGTAILFAHQLMHQATQPAVPVKQIPTDHQKLALFWSVSANNAHVDTYYRLMNQMPPNRLHRAVVSGHLANPRNARPTLQSTFRSHLES